MTASLLIVAQSLGLALLGANPPAARDEASLTLDVRGRDGTKECAITEEVFVAGEMTPISANEGVRVQLYHVRDETTWVPQAAVHVSLDRQGRFAVNLHPTSAGWKPGTLRVVATSRHLRRLRESSDLQVVVPAGKSREPKPTTPSVGQPSGFENASLTLTTVDRTQVEKYSPAASVAVIGRVQPALPRGERVAVRFFHIDENGRRTQQGGVDLMPRSDGQFAFTMDPPNPGWRPGRCRIVATVPRALLLSDAYDIQVVRDGKDDEGERTVRPPVDSGVIIDTEEPPQEAPTVPVGSEFLVRGRYRFVGGKAGDLGSGVSAHIKQGLHPKAPIAQSAIVKGYCEAPDHWWFEIALKAPEQPGRYHLIVRTPRPGGGNPAEVEPHFAGDLIVTPAEAGKP